MKPETVTFKGKTYKVIGKWKIGNVVEYRLEGINTRHILESELDKNIKK